MDPRTFRGILASCLVLCFLASAVSASTTSIKDIPCSVIKAVADAMKAIGASLVAIMFIYGGVKYIYSADDPGGRKQGKNMVIHAIIGSLIMGLLAVIVSMVGASGKMCGIIV
jgi:hypothetical protein